VRLLIFVLGLACLFGLASLWHLRRIDEAREDLAAARELAAGRTSRTDVGVVPEGWAVLMVGDPSGAEPVAQPARKGAVAPTPGEGAAPSAPTDADRTQPKPTEPDTAGPAPAEPGKLDLPVPARELGDFEMAVQAGGVALEDLQGALRERRARTSCVRWRATNELASADSLKIGQRLKLPAPEKLKRLAASRP
jgi:hypothetical protein